MFELDSIIYYLSFSIAKSAIKFWGLMSLHLFGLSVKNVVGFRWAWGRQVNRNFFNILLLIILIISSLTFEPWKSLNDEVAERITYSCTSCLLQRSGIILYKGFLWDNVSSSCQRSHNTLWCRLENIACVEAECFPITQKKLFK